MKSLHVCMCPAFPLSACLYHNRRHHCYPWWSALTDSLLLRQVLAHITPPPLPLPQLSEVEELGSVPQGSELEAETTARTTSSCGLFHLTNTDVENRTVPSGGFSFRSFTFWKSENPQNGWEPLVCLPQMPLATSDLLQGPAAHAVRL